MDNWMEITVLTTTEAADLISEVLLEAGSEGTMIEDKNDVFANQRPEGQWDIIDEAIAERIGDDVKVTGYYPADANLRDVLARIQSELERLRGMELGMELGKLEIRTEGFENENWAEKYVRPGMRVIDIGTGSGILAIAAAHMGAGEVLATDLDATAVRVAEENARINGFGGKIDCRCGDLLDVVDVCGDVVVANIIADVILMLAEPVRARIADGGVFICSGVALERREDVRRALLEANYELLDEPVKGEWAAFAARKR